MLPFLILQQNIYFAHCSYFVRNGIIRVGANIIKAFQSQSCVWNHHSQVLHEYIWQEGVAFPFGVLTLKTWVCNSLLISFSVLCWEIVFCNSLYLTSKNSAALSNFFQSTLGAYRMIPKLTISFLVSVNFPGDWSSTFHMIDGKWHWQS